MTTHPQITVLDGKITHIDNKPGSGVAVLSNYFGRQPGQSLKEFGDELKDLTLDDKVELIGGIVDGTLTY